MKKDTNQQIEIATSKIRENPNNPRTNIESVEDLKACIKSKGFFGTILVRPVDGEKYEVIAGSRRFRACKELGMNTIPCTVRECDDATAYELATAENIVRENMNAVDEANAVAKLFAQGKSRTEIGAMFGKSARWAEGRRRIVELGDKAMEMLAAGKINLGHAEILTMCHKEDIDRLLNIAAYKTPEDLKTYIMNEKPLLERAPFDAKKVCKNCENRSDCQRDLFGDVQNSYCLDRECFNGNVKKEVERIRKKQIAEGFEEVPEDDVYNAQYGFNGWIDADTDDEEEKAEIEAMKEKGLKPMFWIDDDSAEIGFAWKDVSKCENEESDQEESVVDENSWDYQLNKMPYDRKQKVKELASAEEKQIVYDKLQEVFGMMKRETKAFILELIEVGFEDDAGNVTSYLKNSTKASADFLDEITNHIVSDWNGLCLDIREYFGMESREEYERNANKNLPEDFDKKNETTDNQED